MLLLLCSVAQLCPTLCNPMDCSPPGSSVYGIFQERILEWVTISSSRGSSQPRDRTLVTCVSCTGRQILYHCATQSHKCLGCYFTIMSKMHKLTFTSYKNNDKWMRHLPFRSFLSLTFLCPRGHIPVESDIQRSDSFVVVVYLFIYFAFGYAGSLLLRGLFSGCGEQGLLSSYGTWASHCGGFSCFQEWAFGHLAFHSCGSRALEHRLNSCDAGV